MFRDISQFFEENRKIALAFSGGVDSSFLFYTAVKAGAAVRAYYVKTAFQPEFEYQDACRIAEQIGGDMKVLERNITACQDVTANTSKRCYYCKQKILSAILEAAHEDGFELVIDGTNADDDADDRPGMKALAEMKVRSPLRECGYTKEEIRNCSKEAGLFTWNKPAYACLATRIRTGEEITDEKLEVTQRAEAILFELGLSDFRVRMSGTTAKIQVKEKDYPLILKYREKIQNEFPKYYDCVVLDLKSR